MAGSSNIDELGAKLKELVASFNFEMPGIEGSMGEDAAHAVARSIADAAAEQRQPDGKPFPENEPKYAAWKDRKYGVAPPAYGIRTGQTMSLESLLGDVEVSPDRVAMTHGTDRPPERSATGYISEADKKITDFKKALILTNKPPKNIDFYQIGEEGRAAVVEVMREALDRAIGEFNSGGS